MHTNKRGGSIDTEEKAETVVPYIPFSSAQVTIVTPATKLPIAARQSVEETLWEEGDAAVVDIFLFAGAVLMSFTTIFGSIRRSRRIGRG